MESEWFGLEQNFKCHPVQCLCNKQDLLQKLQIWLNTVSATGLFIVFSMHGYCHRRLWSYFFPVCFSGVARKRKIPSTQKLVCCVTGVGTETKYCFSSFLQLLTQPACCNAAVILAFSLKQTKTETTTSCAVIQE